MRTKTYIQLVFMHVQRQQQTYICTCNTAQISYMSLYYNMQDAKGVSNCSLTYLDTTHKHNTDK